MIIFKNIIYKIYISDIEIMSNSKIVVEDLQGLKLLDVIDNYFTCI